MPAPDVFLNNIDVNPLLVLTMNATPQNGVLTEWATSLCHHLAAHRPAAPIAPVIPRLLGPAVERYMRTLIESAIKVQMRAKRATLSVDDVNFALSIAKQEVRFRSMRSWRCQIGCILRRVSCQ